MCSWYLVWMIVLNAEMPRQQAKELPCFSCFFFHPCPSWEEAVGVFFGEVVVVVVVVVLRCVVVCVVGERVACKFLV
jgi:hypothetical protein